jgi:serine/threonine protein phosphatase PrpC
MPLQIKAIGLTDVGIQRETNEDAYVLIQEEEFYVVADGMGGHASGQVASRVAVESLRKYITELAKAPDHQFTFPVHEGAGPPERLISNAIQWANERVFVESMKDGALEGMGTTVVCAKGFGDFLILGHVGDSRVYRYRNGTLDAITRDHSLLNHYIDEGRIRSKEEIANFQETNIIFKALGLKDYVDPEITIIDREPGDLFLLCTDGLTDQVDDWIIGNVIEGNLKDLSEACRALVQLANDAGGRDNCTVVILRVDEPLSQPTTGDTERENALPDPSADRDTEDAETMDGPWDVERITEPEIVLSQAGSIQIDANYQDEVDAIEKRPKAKSRPRKQGATLLDYYDPSEDED